MADNVLRGYTPRELAKVLRVGRDRILGWIRSGELTAINTAPSRLGKPRFVILPSHLEDFQRARRAAAPAPPPKRRRRVAVPVDYYPVS
jgi:excisionase family DNA binding protein